MDAFSMPEIRDTGKVWIKGSSRPVFALRVDEKFFVPGKEEGQSIDYWIEGGCLCVDLCDAAKGRRVARRFRLDLPPAVPAALFSGFEKTKHADIEAVTHRSAGAEEYVLDMPGGLCEEGTLMDRDAFWKRAGFSNR